MSQLIDQRTTARLEAIPARSGPLVLGAATRVLPAIPATGPSLFEQISISVYTFAGNFQWQSLFAIIIPSLVVKFLRVLRPGNAGHSPSQKRQVRQE